MSSATPRIGIIREWSGYLAAIGIGAVVSALYFPTVHLGFALFD